MIIFGDRIRHAREAKGLTQALLADAVGVSQGAISSFESGRIRPSPANLDVIALATGFPPAFFRKPREVEIPLGSLLYRSRSKVKSSVLDQAHGWAGLMAELAVGFSRQLSLPAVRLPHLSGADPVAAAQITRSELGLSPDSPVRNLLLTLERAGLIVLALPYEVEGVDAYCFWLSTASGARRPFVVVSPQEAGDRLRLSVAHEVGHLALHFPLTGTTTAAERDAYAFAAELLTPAVVMRHEIPTPVTLTTLAPLKPRWGVSLQMLVRRTRDLGLTNDSQYHSLNRQIAARGWKRREPANLAVPAERPRALRKMAELLVGEPLDHKQVTTLATAEAMPGAFISAVLASYATASGVPPVDTTGAEAQGAIVAFPSGLRQTAEEVRG